MCIDDLTGWKTNDLAHPLHLRHLHHLHSQNLLHFTPLPRSNLRDHSPTKAREKGLGNVIYNPRKEQNQGKNKKKP